MKFSMIFEAQMVDTSKASEQQVLHDCVEQAVFGEKMGFDCIWAVEHHCLSQYAHMSAPETFLSETISPPKADAVRTPWACA